MKIVVKIFAIVLFVLSFSLVVTGCGSSGGSDAPKSSAVTGEFIDDPVQGMNYTCSSGSSGVTNIDGEFTCEVGDDVTFSIGNIVIGTIAAQGGIITPYSLFPNDLEAALNLARLLQSLDVSPDDGIIILDEGLVGLLPADLDFSSPTFESEVESALGITMVSTEEAEQRLNDAILEAGGVIPSPTLSPSPTPSPTSSPTSSPTPSPTPSPTSGPTPGPTPGPTQPPVNTIPVADAGIDQDMNTTNTVDLNGSASTDADGDALTYSWSITAKPLNSTAALSDATIVNPTFVADKDGTYGIQLIVNDGTDDSDPATVTITAATRIFHNDTTYGIVALGGRIWLDKNLGALRVCTAYNDPECYGDYYQWGRDFDGHQNKNSDVNSTQATDIINAGNNFIAEWAQYDWTTADLNGALRIAKWNAIDGSSVCPVGFKVPTQAEWIVVNNYIDDRADAFNSVLKLPAAGARSYADGDMTGVVTFGNYASITQYDNNNIYYFGFSATQASPYPHMYRSTGWSVRCIKAQ